MMINNTPNERPLYILQDIYVSCTQHHSSIHAKWKICLRFFGNPDWVLPVMGFPIGDSTWYFAFLRRNQTSMSPTHVCILKCIWWPFIWCIVRPSSSPIKRDIWGRKNFESVRPDPVHYGSSDWSGSPGYVRLERVSGLVGDYKYWGWW